MAKNNYLVHHGILGQKWGIRRFQNPDGTLTEEGIKRYRNREDYIQRMEKNYKEKIKSIKSDIKDNTKMLNKLKKEGVNGKTFKSQLLIDDVSDSGRYYNGKEAETGRDVVYKTKKEAFEGLKDYYEMTLDLNKQDLAERGTTDDLKKRIEKIRSVPINERTFIENEDLSKKVGIGVGVVSGIGAAGLSAYALYRYSGPVGLALLGGNAALGGLAVGSYAGISAENAASNIGVKKKNRDI